MKGLNRKMASRTLTRSTTATDIRRRRRRREFQLRRVLLIPDIDIQDNDQTDALQRKLTFQMMIFMLSLGVLTMVHNQICWDRENLRFADRVGDCKSALRTKVTNLVLAFCLGKHSSSSFH